MSFDLSKCEKNAQGHLLCQTKLGWKVRIVATDRKDRYHPLIGLTQLASGEESLDSYTVGGQWRTEAPSDYDLVNIPRTMEITRWLRVTKEGHVCGPYCSKEEAVDQNHPPKHWNFAVVEVKFKCTEGEGLS
jgi:hypothetical protein